MTLQEIENLDRDILIPADIAEVLECDPQFIRIAARRNPEQLGFPVSVVGKRTKIPRIPFIRFMRGEVKGEDHETQ